jgi:hypothetical protein
MRAWWVMAAADGVGWLVRREAKVKRIPALAAFLFALAALGLAPPAHALVTTGQVVGIFSDPVTDSAGFISGLVGPVNELRDGLCQNE